MVLEEAPETTSSPSWPIQLLTLSTKTETALEAATSNLAEFIKAHPDADLADISYTLKVGRGEFKYRRFLTCASTNDATAVSP